MPINGVLTTTLQAVRMSISADGLVFRTRTDKPYRTDSFAQRLRMQYARRG